MSRAFLTRSLQLMSFVGFLAIAIVFFQSLSIPDHKKKQVIMPSTIVIDVSDMQAGELKMSYKYGLPIVVYKRTPEEVLRLKNGHMMVFDDYSQLQTNKIENPYLEHLSPWIEQDADWLSEPWRSFDPKYFVSYVLGPESACGLKFKYNPQYPYNIQKIEHYADVFYDACTNLRYDGAGRVFYNTIEAEQHLFVPPHRVESGQRVVIQF